MTPISTEIVHKVLPGQSISKTDYIARSGIVAALEGESRPLFTPDRNNLKFEAAKNYLHGGDALDNRHALELIVSPRERFVFDLLGANEQDKAHHAVVATRRAMEKVLKTLGEDTVGEFLMLF